MAPTTQTDHHRQLLEGARTALQPLFDSSQQALYVYFDDHLKFCNRRYAQLLGYRDPAEWEAVVEDIPRAFVADESVETAIRTFQATVGAGTAAEVPITWRKKGGKGVVRSRTIFVPFDHEGHRMALHFVQPL